MPAIHAVVAILEFGGREHGFPGPARALADDVEVAWTVGLYAELDAVARMENGVWRNFDHVVARPPQNGVLESESGAGGGSGRGGRRGRNGLNGGAIEREGPHHDARRSHHGMQRLITGGRFGRSLGRGLGWRFGGR